MKNKKKFFQLQLLSLLGLLLINSGFSCTLLAPSTQQLLTPVTLNWWGVYDNPDSFNDIIADYKAIHPNVTINYRKLQPAEFDQELVNALAEDRGPDIFSINNAAIGEYIPKIEPLPAKTTMAYQTTQLSLGIKQETVITVKDTPSLTPPQVQNMFVDAVYHDVVRNNQVYGLPLSVDSLVLFYNRDLLNNAGIPLPPNTWVNLQDDVKKLTYQDNNGKLIQSGAALGTGTNVEHASDILSLLMMQNGAQMTDGQSVTFGQIPPGFSDRTYNPGPAAVQFYTDFANPTKEVYTWADTFPNSLDAFAEGQTAMMFGYNADIAYLEAKRAGKLNYGIAAVPQIQGRPNVNFANYWVQTVSKKSKHINEAWDFIQFMSQATEAKKYLDKTGKPTALRSLIDGESKNDALSVFANQLLTAKSWYTGNNSTALDNAFKDLIETVRTGGQLQDAINIATLKIQQTL